MRKIVIVLISMMIVFTGLNAEEKSKKSEKRSEKKIYLLGGYNFGMGTNKADVKYNVTAYKDEAEQLVNYKLKTGNSFNVALGYKLSEKFALEAGFEVVSQDFENTVKFGIPHPLQFNNPRVFEGKINNLDVKSNVITLNGVYSLFSNKKFEVNILAGASVYLAKAEILSDMKYTESAYPFSTVNFQFYKKEVKKTIFGFNGGLRVHYKFSEKVDFFVKGAYYYGKSEFSVDNSGLNPELDFSGMRLGAGIRFFIK